ncbi:MAG: hypothetical protein CL696_09795 [Chloroflexi bacterium]|jgi:hypothetical protein|nr:hypothetical protein [Chloroflexota bacterium]MDP6496973.1 hypothetical protein [Dehalococcoidia bacterium]MQF89719.1 hypothetical protein [SAR202 cluster bacterium]MDP7588606.1 hypothetical protein [Dehalococcoidia bacterium]MQG11395.1 hypothetical protein [SAR202 cluster bacterium]|tara:strand:- start:101 stop:292 length:192 start_codon:yes stop_codon:yes gene_type:complete
MVIEKDLVENETVTAVVEEKTEPVCAHHWVIEAANGPISWGECQICHEGKEFKNSITDADRDY